MLVRFIYVKKKRDEFGYKRGNQGSQTKKLYGLVNLVYVGYTEFIVWIMR